MQRKLTIMLWAGVLATTLGPVGANAASTKFSGKIYADMSNITQSSDGQDVSPTGYGFDVKRGYFTADTTLDPVWMIRFRTDFNYKSAIGETNVYIKNLYAQAKLGHGVKIQIGNADMPWIPYVENLYRFRYVENVMIDRTHFGNSADWGVHVVGSEGKLNWNVAIVNGGGYKHLQRSKTMDFGGRVDYQPINHLHIGLGAYTGKLDKNTQTNPALHTASRYDAIVAYEGNGYNFGVDYFHAKNWYNVQTPATDSADGYMVFGSYSLTPTIAIFGRYDNVKPSKDQNPALKNTYYNAGVQFIASKQVRFALVYKHSKVEDGTWDTVNGNIGGTTQGKYNEIGVFMQATF